MPPRHVWLLIDHLENRDATLYLDEMQGLLIRFFGRKYKVPLICATLLRYGVNRKRLSLIASRRNDHERTVHLYTVRNYFTAEQILCLDEARIDARSQHREQLHPQPGRPQLPRVH